MDLPPTSVSLLKAIANDTAAVRWTEFWRRYEPAVRSYLNQRYPSVEADDVIQETMLALMKALPEYRYTPDVNGHFRNYLLGIARHKALDAIRRAAALSGAKSKLAADEAALVRGAADPDGEWRRSAMETALEQVMADDSLSPRTREVFRHVALMREPPEAVARHFGISRNNVDQIKARVVAKLSALVSSMLG